MPVGQQDDLEGACGDSLRHPTQTEEDEQAVEATDEGGEIHHHGRCLDGDRRRGKTHQSEQSRDSSGCQEAVEAGGQERKLMEQREQSRTCSSYAES